MNKAFPLWLWSNYPSVDTPLGKSMLDKINVGLSTVDDRTITLDTTKANQTDLLTAIGDVTFDENTGVITFTKKNGSETKIDTKLEKLAVNFSYDSENQRLVITLDDGTIQYVDMKALITELEFLNSNTVLFSVTDGKVSASIVKGSITADMIEPNYLANVELYASQALTSANNASKSAQEAEASAIRAEEAAEKAESIAGGDFATNAKVDNIINGTTPSGDSLKLNGLRAEQVGESGARNILPYPYADTTVTRDGVTFTDNGDGTVTISGAVESRYGYIYLARTLILNKGTYTIKVHGTDGLAKVTHFYTGSDGNQVTLGSGLIEKTFEIPEDGVTYGCWLGYWGTEETTLTVAVSLEHGTVAHEWRPYHFGGAEDALTLNGLPASAYTQGVSPYFQSGETILSWANNPNGAYRKFAVSGAFPSDIPLQAEGFIELKIDGDGARRKVTFYQFGTANVYEREIFNGAWRADKWSHGINGGDADTVGGYHAYQLQEMGSDGLPLDGHYIVFRHNVAGDNRFNAVTNTGHEVSVNYATNADTVDGLHASNFKKSSYQIYTGDILDIPTDDTYCCDASNCTNFPPQISSWAFITRFSFRDTGYKKFIAFRLNINSIANLSDIYIACEYVKDSDGNMIWKSVTEDYLPLDLSVPLTGRFLKLYGGTSFIEAVSNALNVGQYNVTDGVVDSANGRWLRVNSVLKQSDLDNALQFVDKVNGSQTRYSVLHTGNMANHVLPLDGSVPMSGPLTLTNGATLSKTGVAQHGGQITFEKSDESILNGNMKLQLFSNGLRVIETGGNSRGATLDLTECGDWATSAILHTGNSAKVVVLETPLTAEGSVRVW